MYRNIPLLYRVMESFFRYRNLFLVSAVVVTAIPAAVLLTRKPTYTSTAMIQVIEDLSTVLGDTKAPSWTPSAQQNVNKFNDLMGDDKTGGFVDLALQKANLSRPITVDPRAKDPRLAQLHKGLSISTSSDTVFTINLVWDNAEECENLVRALQDQYVETIGEEKQLLSKNVTKFLEEEKKSYGERLAIAEKAVRDFKNLNHGTAPEAMATTYEQLSNLKTQLNDMEISSHNNDIKHTELLKRLSQIKPTSIKSEKTLAQEDPLATRKKKLETEKNDLLAAGWLPTSTRVQALEAQIKSTQEEIEAQAKNDPNHGKAAPNEVVTEDNPEWRDLQSQLTEVNINLSTDKSQVAQLHQRIGEYETRLAGLPNAEINLNDRIRDADILKTQYEDISKRLEQSYTKTNLDKVSATSTLRTIGTVYAQSTGGKAKTTLMLVGLLIFGLILGVGVTLLAEWADPTVRYASDVQRALGVPVLISLPEMAPLLMVNSAPSEGEISGGRPLLPARDE